MSAIILYKEQPPRTTSAMAEGQDLWVPVGELHGATGWELRPEGVCRGEMCVPIPPGRDGEFLRDGAAWFNLAALARRLGQPVVHDDAHGVWSFGESADAHSTYMQSLRAPDFTLPDLDGRLHALADYRGKRIFLVFWASW